jgi:Ca2+-binding RTX toxin-like protein
VLTGSKGPASLYGGPRDDWFCGGPADDLISGGSGDDTADGDATTEHRHPSDTFTHVEHRQRYCFYF